MTEASSYRVVATTSTSRQLRTRVATTAVVATQRVSSEAVSTMAKQTMITVPEEQRYYWSPAWQQAEAESRREHAAGKARRFETAEDAVAWLLDDDD
jgi:hypothetical protein